MESGELAQKRKGKLGASASTIDIAATSPTERRPARKPSSAVSGAGVMRVRKVVTSTLLRFIYASVPQNIGMVNAATAAQNSRFDIALSSHTLCVVSDSIS